MKIISPIFSRLAFAAGIAAAIEAPLALIAAVLLVVWVPARVSEAQPPQAEQGPQSPPAGAYATAPIGYPGAAVAPSQFGGQQGAPSGPLPEVPRTELSPNNAGSAGSADAAPSRNGAQEADSLLQAVMAALERTDSLSARVRQQVELFDNQILGTGVYFQQGHAEQRLTRLEVRSQISGQVTTLLEVCDGRVLWTFHALPAGPNLTRVDLERVKKGLAEAAQARADRIRDFQIRQQLAPQRGDANNPGELIPLTDRTALSGLPKLLEGLRDTFQFDHVSAARIGELPVWRVEGGWKPARLAVVAPDQKANLEAGRPLELKRLPAQLPERVVIEVGQQDLIPYRVAYLRRGKGAGARGSPSSGESGGNGSAAEGDAAAAGSYRAIVTFELFDVHVNVAIDPRQFTFQAPAGVPTIEGTEAYMKNLNLAPAAK